MEVDIPQEVAEIARQEEESARAAELLEAELEKEKAKEKMILKLLPWMLKFTDRKKMMMKRMMMKMIRKNNGMVK